jgi:hypothetical protein
MSNYRSVADQLTTVVDNIINRVIPSLRNGTATGTAVQNTGNKLKQAQAQIDGLQKSFASEAIPLLQQLKAVPFGGKNYFNKSMFGGFKVKKYPTLYHMPLVLALLKTEVNRAKNANQKVSNAKKANNNAKKAQNEEKKKETNKAAAISKLNQAARGIKAQIGNNTGLSNSRVNEIRNRVSTLTQ